MKGFNGPELRPPGGSGLKRETSPESLFSFARNPLEEHRVVNKKTEPLCVVPFFIVLLGSEDTVAGIAETWEDVVMIIELTIEGSCVDRHIRMSLVDDFNAFRCGYEAHELLSLIHI